jgi:hypothetical protein
VFLNNVPDVAQQGVEVLLLLAGGVGLQVEVQWDLQQVGHLLRVKLVLQHTTVMHLENVKSEPKWLTF